MVRFVRPVTIQLHTHYWVLEEKRVSMNAFFNSQFSYCPLVWIWHGFTLNNKIDDYSRYVFELYTTTKNMMMMVNRFCGIMADRRRTWAPFPTGTIVRDSHNPKTSKRREQDLNPCKSWVQVSVFSYIWKRW